jgi:hypothetical protein
MTWYYEHALGEFEESHIGDNVGFVYCITNNITGQKYIGKKLFTKSKTKQVKGKKKKSRVSSDWMDYYGSSEVLKEEVKQNGPENYTREILHLCKTRSWMSYHETYEIFSRHALLSEHYYNGWVSCRIRKDHLKKT